jgi:predicted DNA-binding protein (MmcQ/YjbR family)
MKKREFLEYCLVTYGTSPDYPFEEDFETAVLRHADTRKWYGIVMKVPRRKFGFDSDEAVDVVNLKLPLDMYGSFGAADGVYPAYHMNKMHWISVLLPDAQTELTQFLTSVSYDATKEKKKRKK